MQLERGKRLRSSRSTLDSLWQDVEDHFGGVEGITRSRLEGEERIVLDDSTPIHMARGFALTLGSLLRPRGVRWAKPTITDQGLVKEPEVAKWLDVVGDRMHRATYATESRFVEQTSRVDYDIARFATGVLYVDLNTDINRLRFRAYHPKTVCFDANDQGEIDSVWRWFELSPSQSVNFFGKDKVSDKVRRAAEKGSTEKIEYAHMVYPQDDEDRPFYGVYVEVGEKNTVDEGGFFEMPYVIPRMNVPSGSLYGYSPCMDALPDARMLQQIAADLRAASELQLSPPLLAAAGALGGGAHLYPGGMTYFDPSKLTGNQRPLEALNLAGSIPVGLEHQAATREMLRQGFMRDILSLPDGANMTATEVIRRNEDMARIIGPLTDVLLPDYNGKIADRVFGIMARSGQFPEAPEEIQGRTVVYEYENPITRSEREVDLARIQEMLSFVGGAAQLRPEVLDVCDIDEMIRDYARLRGTSAKYVREPETVDGDRAKRAEEQAMMQAVEQAGMAGDAAQRVGAGLDSLGVQP